MMDYEFVERYEDTIAVLNLHRDILGPVAHHSIDAAISSMMAVIDLVLQINLNTSSEPTDAGGTATALEPLFRGEQAEAVVRRTDE